MLCNFCIIDAIGVNNLCLCILLLSLSLYVFWGHLYMAIYGCWLFHWTTTPSSGTHSHIQFWTQLLHAWFYVLNLVLVPCKLSYMLICNRWEGRDHSLQLCRKQMQKNWEAFGFSESGIVRIWNYYLWPSPQLHSFGVVEGTLIWY